MFKTALNKIVPFTLGVLVTLTVLSISNPEDSIGLVSSLNYQDAVCDTNQVCETTNQEYQVAQVAGSINDGVSDSIDSSQDKTPEDTIPTITIEDEVIAEQEVKNPEPLPISKSNPAEIVIDLQSPDVLFELGPGVNLAQAEFAPNDTNFQHSYPTASLDYYASIGVKLIRLPFLWERMQPTLFGPLAPSELNMLDEFLTAAAAKDMHVILDLHNYGRYKGNLIGSSQVPVTALRDVWNKLSTRYKNNTTVVAYGLMNEPHDMGDPTLWKNAAQQVVDEIRTIDANTVILVAGDSWSSTWYWQYNNTNLIINDPSNKIVYEGHIYFDTNNAGIYECTYDTCNISETTISSRLDGYLQWLEDNNVKGFIGEYGAPSSDARWNALLDKFLLRLDQKSIGSTIWAGGGMWGSYVLSIEPSYNANGTLIEKPQVSLLKKYLNKCERINKNGISSECLVRVSPGL